MTRSNTESFVHLPLPHYNCVFVKCTTLREALRECPDAKYVFETEGGYVLFDSESEAYMYAYMNGLLPSYWRQYNYRDSAKYTNKLIAEIHALCDEAAKLLDRKSEEIMIDHLCKVVDDLRDLIFEHQTLPY